MDTSNRGSTMTTLIGLGRVSRETKELDVAVTKDGSFTAVLGKCKNKSGNLLTVVDFGNAQVNAYSNVAPYPNCGTI